MIELVDNPCFEIITYDSRPEGLSGFIRAKNEGDYIYQVIESWLNIVDEIVVVFNDCTDNTKSEIERAINDFSSSKVRAYEYLPTVYPQGSKEHIELSPNSINSLVYYYNFSLYKTRYKYAVKIDGDIIFDSSKKDIITSFIKENRKDSYFKLHGVNLIDNNGILYVPSNSKFCGLNGDLCIFPVHENNNFKWKKEFEYLDLTGLNDAGGDFFYYHMKFVKSDMGFGNYLLQDNPNSRYIDITKNFTIGLSFLNIIDVLKSHNIKLTMPDKLNISPVEKRFFKKEYELKLKSVGVSISKKNIPMTFIRNKWNSFIFSLKLKVKKQLGL